MSSGNSICEDGKYIEHEVSRMDTLAGIAIKYGVEVAEIRRLNNLVTDLQIFARKTLLIPLHGRHPPSPGFSSDSAILPNGSASPRNSRTTKRAQRGSSNILDVMQSLSKESRSEKVSPAMSTLQKFFQLKPLNPTAAIEETETAVYRRSASDNITSAMFPKTIRLKSQKSGHSSDENTAKSDCIDAENENTFRRRRTLDADSRTGSSDSLSKEENNGFPSSPGNGVAMRTKSASRTTLSAGPDSEFMNTIPVGMGDSLLMDDLAGETKPSSVSTPQEEDWGSSLSLWPTSSWSLKADFQALSTASISIPIFNGGRRKTALD